MLHQLYNKPNLINIKNITKGKAQVMMPVPRIKIYIMVLEDGRIIERGSHEQLIAEKGKYYHAVFRYNGKQIWRSTGVKVKGGRKKDAERIKNEIIQNYINGINPNGDMLLTQYLDSWIKRVGSTLKPSTYEDYEKRVYGKLIPYFESKNLYFSFKFLNNGYILL